MKRIFTLTLLLATLLPLCAQRTMRTLLHMEQLQRAGQTLEAMDSATVILTRDADNQAAKNFIHQHWEKTMKAAQQQLVLHKDEHSVEDTKKRLYIYRLLDNINQNLQYVRMPLRGPRDSWVWQPEISYYTGTYSTEQMKAFNLFMKKANEALDSYNVAEAQEHYAFILEHVYTTPGEHRSVKRKMRQAVNTHIASVAAGTEIHQLLAHYNMLDLSLWLDPTQTEFPATQQALRPVISEHYLQLSETYAAQGDSILALENRQLAKDWK